MDRTERFYIIDRLLKSNRTVSLERMLSELGISRATFKRDLEYLRDRFHAPIVWDSDLRGYRFESNEKQSGFALPGFWLSAAEIRALLAMEHLIESLEPGFLSESLKPLKQRLEHLLSDPETPSDMKKRVRLLHMATRPVSPPHFAAVAAAVFGRKRLRLDYHVRERAERTIRDVSPQRLTYYRDNWYLDGWCHWRKAIRNFALDAMKSVTPLDEPAIEVKEAEINRLLASGYGIFGGEAKHWAKLRFTAIRARWVSQERWHPKQKSRVDDEGRYVLEVPYYDSRELVMDILRHAGEVEVLAPASLREKFVDRLKAATKQHS